jgi:putative nucleotidyltransferase with HDIG domain
MHESLERFLTEHFELPVLPEAAARVVALAQDPDSGARDLQRVLERDPSLASHVLRIANSAAFAPREPIVSLQQAVSRLGMTTIRDLALAASLQSRVYRAPGYEDLMRTIWTHCAVAAVFAREIARRMRRNVEGAFLCGLLHDVGRPVVVQAALEAPGLLQKSSDTPVLLDAAMDEFHARVGARLVEAWGLAEWTAAVVAHHHEPRNAGAYEEEACIARLADLLSHWALAEGSCVEDFPDDDAAVLDLNLYAEDVEALLALRDQALSCAEALR